MTQECQILLPMQGGGMRLDVRLRRRCPAPIVHPSSYGHLYQARFCCGQRHAYDGMCCSRCSLCCISTCVTLLLLLA
jgi:hypothetical protein